MRQKPIQRLEATTRSVSKVRFRPANPFEHKRNFKRESSALEVYDGIMAEGVGFEPTVDLRPRQFSRLLP